MKKVLLTTILTILLLSFTMQVSAQTEKRTEAITPMWINIMNISAYLSIDSSGTATCSSDMLQSLSNGSCTLVMNLQKLNSGKWGTVATWTETGSIECSNIAYKDVTKGTYRLSVTGKVYDGSGYLIETATNYSTTKTY